MSSTRLSSTRSRRLPRLLGTGVATASLALGMVALTQAPTTAATAAGVSPPGTYTPVQIAKWTYTSAGGRPVQLTADAPKGVAGPLPTIIFGVGYDTTFADYATLTNELVSAGYLVIGVDGAGYSAVYPSAISGGSTAVLYEVHDMQTALPQAEKKLGSLIDTAHVTAAGDSNGGDAVDAIALNSNFCDHSYQTFVSIGSDGNTQPISTGWTSSCNVTATDTSAPMLFQTPTIGRYSNPDWTDQLVAKAYAQASPPAAYIVSNNAGHISSFLCPSQIPMAGGEPAEVSCTSTLDAEAASFRSALVAWLNAWDNDSHVSMTTFEKDASSNGLSYQQKGGFPAVTAVGIAVDPATGGYWVLTSNGGVFNFDAPWAGSPKAAGTVAGSAVTGIAATPNGKGYVVSRANGGVDNYGTPWYGSEAGKLP